MASNETIIEKINGLDTLIKSKFEETHSRLDKINGRVNKHEEIINEALVERSKNREEQRQSLCKIDKIEEKIESIENEFEDLGFFIRNPKLFIAILVVIVLLTLATFLNNNPFKAFRNVDLPLIENTR